MKYSLRVEVQALNVFISVPDDFRTAHHANVNKNIILQLQLS